MPNDGTWPGSSSAPDLRLTSVQRALALLTQQPVLLAVTLPHTVGDERYAITVSKAVDDAGHVQAMFWWEVDRLAGQAQGQPRRERRWGLGLRACETVEAAYLAAVPRVERRRAAPPTSTDNAVQ